MADGYIGKISAVVTANTSDLEAKLRGGVKSVDTFANSLTASLKSASKSAVASVQQTFTPLQQFERKMQMASKLNLKFDTTNLRGLVSIAEQINKPLSGVARQLGGMGLDIQAAFLPALKNVQSQAALITREMEKTGTVGANKFAYIEKSVNQLAVALGRVVAAEAAVKGLSGGQELSLRRPGFSGEINRTKALQEQAMSTGGMGDLAEMFSRQKQAANEAAVALTKMESAQRLIGTDASAATAEYNRQLESLRQINNELQKAISANKQTSQNRTLEGSMTGAFYALTSKRQRHGISEGEIVAGLEAQAMATRAAVSGAMASPAQYGRLKGQMGEVAAQINTIIGEYRKLESEDPTRLQVLAWDDLIKRLEEAQYKLAAIEAVAKRVPADVAAAASARKQSPTQADDRIGSINAAWDAAIRGVATSTSGLDAQLFGVLSRIGGLDIQDRLDLDPLIKDFRDAAAAGEPLFAQFQKLLAVEEKFNSIKSQPGRNFVSREGDASGTFGPSFQPFVTNLGGDIDATRAKIATLDEPLRAQLGPEIDRITIQFQNMARSGLKVSTDEARRLAGQVAAINASLSSRRDIGQAFSEKFGGAGQSGLSLGVDSKSLQATGGQIEFVQQRLSRLGAEARGPTLAALQQFRETARRLFDAGTIDTESGRAELALVRKDLIFTMAAATGMSQKKIATDLSRAGDVGRMGFDKFGLAAQQAAFALDDFFSVTGGFDQRLRAIGNNLTQLSFLLGGTKGLFIGVAAVVGGQIAVGLYKWVNAGKSSEDMAKALNDVMARQKTLAEELSQSFAKLGESIVGKAFSSAGKEGLEFRKELAAIAKQLDEVQQKAAESTNPRAFAISGEINKLNRELQTTEDPGMAAAKFDRIRQLEAELDRIRKSGGAATTAFAADIQGIVGAGSTAGWGTFAGAVASDAAGTILKALASATVAGFTTPAGGMAAAGVMFAPNFANNLDSVLSGADAKSALNAVDPSNLAAIQAIIERRMAEINPIITNSSAMGRFASGKSLDIAKLTNEYNSLRSQRDEVGYLKQVGDAMLDATRSANVFSMALDDAQKIAAEALKAGAQGASEFAATAEELAVSLKKAEADRQEAFGRKAYSAEERSKRLSDINAARERIAGLTKQVPLIQERTDAVQTQLAVNRDATTQFRIDKIRSNLSGLKMDTGPMAIQFRAMEARQQILQRQQSNALANGDIAAFRVAGRSIESLGREFDLLYATTNSATEAVKAFSDSLQKVSSDSSAMFQDAQRRVDDASRSNISMPTPFTRQESEMAKAELDKQREAMRNVEDAVAASRARATSQAMSDRQGYDAASAERDKALARVDELKAAKKTLLSYSDTIANPDAWKSLTDAQREKMSEDAKAAAKAFGMDSPRGTFEQLDRGIADALGAVAEKEKLLADETARFEQTLVGAASAIAKIDEQLANGSLVGGDVDRALARRRDLQNVVDKENEKIAAASKSARDKQMSDADAAASAKRGIESIKALTGIAAGEDLQKKLNDIRNAPALPGLNQQQNEALRNRAVEGAWREAATGVAPAIMSLYDSVQNAILSGPSRAALNASDVSTVDGAKELNRLLRGEDPNKDQNLVELRSQSQSLRELVRLGQQRVDVGVANN